MAKYRAKAESYGFRGRHWLKGDVAENVTEDENIPDHFEPAPEEVVETPKDESFDPPEPTTLSEWQQHGDKTQPGPGLEKSKPKPDSEKPKAKRK